MPLCFFSKSIGKKWTSGTVSKKGLKKGLEITVIFTSGCCATNARITGTVIATSPIAESRITAICLMDLDKIIFYSDTIPGSNRRHYTFSSVCKLS